MSMRPAAGRRAAAAAAALAALALVAASPALPGALADSHGAPEADPAAPQLIPAGFLTADAAGSVFRSITDVSAFSMNGTAHAVATSYQGDVHLLRVGGSGAPSPVGAPLRIGNTLFGIDAFSMNGSAYAIVSQTGASAMKLVRIHGNGTMVVVDTLGNSGDRELDGPRRVEAFSMNGSMHAIVAAWGGGGGVQLVRIHANGTLEAPRSGGLPDTSGLRLANAYGVAVLELDDGPHALVSAYAQADRGVQLVRIHANGTLEARGSLGAGFNGASDVAAFEMNGTAHALVAFDTQSAGAKLVRIHGNGTLEEAGSLQQGGSLRLLGAHGAAAFKTATGAWYGLVASYSDTNSGGVQLVRIHANGTLAHLGLPGGGAAAAGTAGFGGVRGAYAADAFSLDGRAYAIVGSWVWPSFGAAQLIELSPVAIARVNSTAADDYYGPGSQIDIAVTFDDDVAAEGPLELRLNTGGAARYHNGSGTDTLVFRYTAGLGENTGDLDYANVNALSGKGSIAHAATGVPAGRALPSPGSGASLGGMKDIAVLPAPASSTDGVYGASDRIDIRVVFDGPVSYRGDAPILLLNVSGEPREAAYESGSGTRSLAFSYTVRAGDYEEDLDYYGEGALSGAIVDAEGSRVDTALPPPGSPGSLAHTHDVLVDHAAPRLIGNGSLSKPYTLDVDTIAVNGSTYAVVAHGNALEALRVHANGTLEAAGTLAETGDPDNLNLTTAYGVDAFYMGGSAYAIAASEGDGGGVQLARILNNGTLVAAGALPDDSDLALNAAVRVAAFEMDGAMHALVAARGPGGGVQLVRISEGGLEARGSLNRSELEHAGAFGVAILDMPGRPHALVSGSAGNGVQLIRANADGTLSIASSLADDGGLALGTPRDVAALTLGGRPHALVASEGDHGAQLLRIGGDGSIEAAAGPATDGARGFDELYKAHGVDAFALGGGTHALVASRGDSGLQLIRVRGDGGILFPHGSAAHGSPGFPRLNDAFAVHAFTLDGSPYAIVSSAAQGGLQLVKLSPAAAANVTSRSASGTYGVGDAVNISVAFDGRVDVAGPLELRLNTGGAAGYASGNGTGTLVFRYVVAAGDSDAARLDYAGLHALRAGLGGSITESGTGVHARTVLPPPGSNGSLGGSARIAVDTPPLVERVSTPNASGTYGIGDEIHVRAKFTEPVLVEETPLLALDAGGASRSAAYSSGSGTASLLFLHTVAEGDAPGALSYAAGSRILLPAGASVKDLAGNAANLTLPAPSGAGDLLAGAGLAVDGARPAVASVSTPNATGTYRIGDAILVNVTFDEPVLAAGGPPLLALDMGGANRTAEYASGNGTASLLFSYTVAAGDMSGGLDYAGGSALSPGPGGSIADAAGNAANLALPAPSGGSGSLGGAGLAVDGVRRADAMASAAFVGPNTVRIDYAAPLGPPAWHEGPVYGNVTVSGAAAAAPPVAEFGLGTQAHTVRFGGDGAARDRSGTISLLADLVGEAGGMQYGLADDVIPVRPGSEARRLAPPAAAPVVAIEADGYVREVDSTAAGAAACPSINVTSLASASGSVALPGERVGMMASFAEAWFPPNATASPAPAGGLLRLCVSPQPPSAGAVAAGLGLADAAGLEVLTVVEIGDDGAHVWFTAPVRIVLAGQAGADAFYANATSGAVVPIAECAAGPSGTPALPSGESACHADSANGRDMTIYTLHLTQFGAARPAAGGNGGNGGADGAAMCGVALDRRDVRFGRVEAGAQSPAASQVLRSAGTLGIDEVSITATAWADGAGRTVLPAGATRVLNGTAGWLPLGAEAVDLRAGGAEMLAVNFSLAVPPDALAEGAPAVQAIQNVTYAVSCALRPE